MFKSQRLKMYAESTFNRVLAPNVGHTSGISSNESIKVGDTTKKEKYANIIAK